MVLVHEFDVVLARQIRGSQSISIADGDDLDVRDPLEACDVQPPLEAAPHDTDPEGRLSLETSHLIITLP
jgi:hypothetical protein